MHRQEDIKVVKEELFQILQIGFRNNFLNGGKITQIEYYLISIILNLNSLNCFNGFSVVVDSFR